MSALPSSPLPPKKPGFDKTTNWPPIINLTILLIAVVVVKFDMDALSGVLACLMFINGLTGGVLLLVNHRISYAPAFFLSVLLILLIGFGVCGWPVPGS